jgi:hypothetical protein
MSDSQYCLLRADDYRQKAQATNNDGVRLALEAVVREYLRKAEEFSRAGARNSFAA